MDTDRNLLFGVLALQADLIDPARFAEACSAWASRKETPLADLLLERGWLTPGDRVDIEKLLERKLKKHGNNAHAGLVEVTTDQVRLSLSGVADADVRHSLNGSTPPAPGHVLLATTAYVPEAGERYTLTRLHATGGIGRVWLARDASLGRDVALKELRPERSANPSVWARFLKEAQVTGQLEHPGIVPIYEVGQRPADQAPFYTMRFVRGRTLAEAVAAYHKKRLQGEAGPLELRELLGAFVGVCNAVAYAHSRGVLHRDLKPQNIVLGDYGEVIVLDWGLARLMKQPEGDEAHPPLDVAAESGVQGTLQGQVLGTPAYMAPEQAEGRLDLLGPATDVYGLGAVLYEILTGRPPFTGTETAGVLSLVIHEPPTRPRLTVPTTAAALEAVCLKALAKKSAQRYASAKELAEEVQRWLADEPVAAYREPAPVRLSRWARRHRTLVASAAALLIAVTVGLAVGTVLLTQANARTEEQRRQAEVERERAEANFQKARRAVDEYYTKVSENKLLDVPGLQPLRKDLLQSARDYYKEFLNDHAQDRAVRSEAAEAWYRLGLLSLAIGPSEEALDALQNSAVAYEALATEHPEEPRYRFKHAMCLNDIGLQQAKLGRPTEATKTHEECVRIREALAREYPSEVEYRKELAIGYRNLGQRRKEAGRDKDGMALKEKSRELYTALVREFPESPDYRNRLGGLLLEIGLDLQYQGRKEEAERTFKDTIELLEKLVRDKPKGLDYQSNVAAAYTHLGFLQVARTELEPGLDSTRHALKFLETLVKENPALPGYRLQSAYGNQQIGSLLTELGREAEGLEASRRALALYEETAAKDPNNVYYQAYLAEGRQALGILLSQAGKPVEAAAEFEKARTMRQKLVDASPTNTDFQSDLAISHIGIGNLLNEAGKPKEALASCEKAQVIRQKLVDANPTTLNFQRDLANGQTDVAALLFQLGKSQEALRECEKAQATRQKLADAEPANIEFRRELATHHGAIGFLLSEIGKPEEALAAYDKAQALRQKLADADPTNTSMQSDLAAGYNGIGALFKDAGKPKEALAAYEQAQAIRQKLADAHPTIPAYQNELAGSLNDVADALRDLGKFDDARAVHNRAIALREKLVKDSPTVLRYRFQLAYGLKRLVLTERADGKNAAAVAAGKRARALYEELPPRSTEELIALAGCLALLGDQAGKPGSGLTVEEGRTATDKAGELLRQAIAAGYGNTAQLRKDPCLEPLRQRDDFKKLIQGS